MKFVGFCNKIIEYSFYAIFFLVPLFFTNDTSELFELNKMWLTWGLAIIIGTFWFARMIYKREFRLQKTPFDIPILLFLASQTISTIFSLDRHVSFWGYYSRFNGGLLSLLTFVFLYYALTSNFHYFTSGIKHFRFSRGYSILIFFSALLLIPFSIKIFAANINDPESAHPMLLFSSLILTFFLFLLSFPRHFLYRLLLITLASGLVVALWGIPSHFSQGLFSGDPTCFLFRGTYDTSCWTEQFQPTVRIFSTLGQPAWLAAYIAALLPLAIAFGFLGRKFLDKSAAVKQKHSESFIKTLWPHFYIAVFLAFLFYVTLIFANTRGGFIGFWVANVFMWAVLGLRELLTKSETIKHYIFSLVVFNAIFLICTFFLGTPLSQLNKFTLPEIKKQAFLEQKVFAQSNTRPTQNTKPAPSGITDSGDIRLIVWKGAFEAWKDNPLIGSGVETFAFTYYLHRPAAHNMTSEWDFLYNKAHNEYLNYLATTGILGLGTYVLMILFFFFLSGKYLLTLARHSFHNTNDQSRQSSALEETRIDPKISFIFITALVAAYISILISNFTGFSVVIMNIFLFLIPAFVFILTGKLKVEKESVSNKEEVNIYQWSLLVVLFVFSSFLLLKLYWYWDADKAYAKGSNLNNSRIALYDQALPLLSKAVMLRGSEPVFKNELAGNSAIQTLLVLQNDATSSAESQQKAGQFAQQAVALSNEVTTKYPNNILFWKNRAQIFLTLGQVRKEVVPLAIEAMEKARLLAPTDAKILFNLGVIYEAVGEDKKAIASLEKATSLKPDYRDAYFKLANLYWDMKSSTPSYKQKAIDALQFILANIAPNDQQSKDTLKTWGVKK